MALKNGVDFSSLSFGVPLKFEASSLTQVPGLPRSDWLPPVQWLQGFSPFNREYRKPEETGTSNLESFHPGFHPLVECASQHYLASEELNSAFQTLEGCLKMFIISG